MAVYKGSPPQIPHFIQIDGVFIKINDLYKVPLFTYSMAGGDRNASNTGQNSDLIQRPDHCGASFGQAADRADGAYGICSDHAPCQFSHHSHGGSGLPHPLRHRPHCFGLFGRNPFVSFDLKEHLDPQAFLRKAGNFN